MNLEKGHISSLILGVADATNALIAEKLERGINKSLEVLSKPLGVSAAFVGVNHKGETGEFLTSVKYFWSDQPLPSRFEHNQNITADVLKDVLPDLLEGDFYELMFSESSNLLREHMGLDGTKSLILFPVNVEGRFWGILGLVDFRYERTWSQAEKSLLQSFSNSIGNAVCRHLLEQNLEHLIDERTKQLESSQRRFQLAVEGSQDGIWDWQPQENKGYWSPRMYQQLGYEPNEFPVPGENFFDMLHPNDVLEATDKFNRHLHYKEPYEVEFRLKTKPGDYKWFKSTGQAEWDEDGIPIRVVGSHEDIHDKKIGEGLLKKQEERFRAIFRDDPNSTFLVNNTGEIELHSDKAVEVFGYSHKEFLTMSIHELLPNGSSQVHKDHLLEYFKSPKVREFGHSLGLKGKKKNGDLFWVEVGLSPVKIEEETLVMAVVTDITKRREAEIALEESHRRMNSLVNNLPGLVYRCLNDKKWTMQYISAACWTITGYHQEEFYGDPSDITYGDLIHVDDQVDVWEQVQHSINLKEAFRVVYRIIDKNKREKWLWEQGNGVFDKDGKLEALEGCIFDITLMVRNQEKQNQAIYNAENRERRRIASDIHDGLQQTLSVSALNLQYLEEEISKLSQDCQDRYKKSKEFLEKGISDSRNIAHQLMPKSIDKLGLDKTLQDLVLDLEEASGIKCSYYSNFKGRLDSAIEVGLFRTVQEALNNILKSSNAKHANVQLVRVEEGIQLMIEDDGIGFDKNKLDLYKTGFGLTGMKNRIGALSGSLTIDSTPNHGTSIIALIPLNK